MVSRKRAKDTFMACTILINEIYVYCFGITGRTRGVNNSKNLILILREKQKTPDPVQIR